MMPNFERGLDEQSVSDARPTSGQVCGFFSGIGGFELGFQRAGFEVISVCEIDPFCNQVLAKHWPNVPNLGDIRYLSVAFHAKTYPSLGDWPVLTVSKADYFAIGSLLSTALDLIGLSPRTSHTRGVAGCPSCGVNSSYWAIPACRFECEPLTWERHTSGRASSLLPTPTASSYGSCRGGGAGRAGKWRKSLDTLKIGDPEQRERMMGFPIGWTEIAQSEMPLSPKSRKSSRQA